MKHMSMILVLAIVRLFVVPTPLSPSPSQARGQQTKPPPKYPDYNRVEQQSQDRRSDQETVRERDGGGHTTRDVAIGAGVGVLAGVLLGKALGGGGNEKPEKILSEKGPQFPGAFSMSAITVMAFVKGNWPFVIEYEMRQPGIALLSIVADGVAPFIYQLDSRPGRQQFIIRQLPARFGDQVRPATYSIRALSNGPGELQPIYFRVFGLGAGPRAVGSVGIDQLRFGPASIHPKLKQKAMFGFHSRSDFDKVTAEFMRAAGGQEIVTSVVDKEDIKEPVRRNSDILNKEWNAKKVAPGPHMLQIRGWTSLKNAGDWVVAWSPQIVGVEE